MKFLLPALLAFILTACLPGLEVQPVELAAPTARSMEEQEASTAILPDTPIQFTPIPTFTPTTASPTSVSPQITAGTASRLTIFSVFGQGEDLRSLAFSPDGNVLASAGGNTEDFAIRIWEVDSGTALETLDGHAGIVWELAFSPDGNLLASVSSDGTGKIWDWRTGTLLESLSFAGQVISVSFSPDGQTVAMGGTTEWPDAAIWTFSVPSWQPELKLNEFWNIPAIVFTPDGKYLVGGGTSRNARVWRSSDGAEIFTLYHSGQVSSLAMSPNSYTVAAGLCEAAEENGTCKQGAVWFWNVFTGELIHKSSGFSEWVESVAYTTDGSMVVAGMRDGSLHFYSAAGFEPIPFAGPRNGTGIIAVAPNGRFLATTGNNGSINLWRVGP